VGNKLLDNLAAIFWFLPPYLGIVYFWLSGTPKEELATIVYYLAYAISATILSGGYWLLCKRAKGKVAAWLVSVAYAETFFAITLWGLIILIIINMLSPGQWGEHDREILAAISRGRDPDCRPGADLRLRQGPARPAHSRVPIRAWLGARAATAQDDIRALHGVGGPARGHPGGLEDKHGRGGDALRANGGRGPYPGRA
jgi:hypothetical protein